MTGRRPSSFKEREATKVLVEALRGGSLHPNDTTAATELITSTLPDIARLKYNAIRNITKVALQDATKAVPQEPDPQTPARSPQHPVPSGNAAYSPRHPNSNDMLPAARPKPPSQSVQRKRRRLSEAPTSPSQNAFLAKRPSERLEDVGGIPNVMLTIQHHVEWPLRRRPYYNHIGVDPPRGVLLHGPPGCGKTMLAHAIAGSLDVPFFRVSGPEIVSGVSGESERTLRSVFDQAVKLAPSIIFIDEVDAIAARRDNASKDMERRIISQLLSCIDGLALKEGESSADRDEEEGDKDGGHTEQAIAKSSSVVVLAATNRLESLEPALRRAGRLDREVELGAPDEGGRRAILTKLCRGLRLESSFDISAIAKRTAGYVGADLSLLVKEAGLSSIRRFIEGKAKVGSVTAPGEVEPDVEMEEGITTKSTPGNSSRGNISSAESSDDEGNAIEDAEMAFTGERMEKVSLVHKEKDEEDLTGLKISLKDFNIALDHIQPSALREGFATRPNVSWENIGSLEHVREEMMMAIVEPIRRPEIFESLGLQAAGGVLLYGPPGCGKTLLARAVAAESGANFISVKGPELLSKYVGDSELAVRRVFSRARSSAPCIIFFDELDALAPRRGSGGGGAESSGAAERVVNMLLTEMDGFVGRTHVFVIAATNRPDMIDPAMLRPGRLDKLVLVPLPDSDGRVSILQTLVRNVTISGDVDLEKVAKDQRADGYSGADVQALIRMAGETALREHINTMGSAVAKVTKNGSKSIQIEAKHFMRALDLVKPSVSLEDACSYLLMEERMRKSRARVQDHGRKGGSKV